MDDCNVIILDALKTIWRRPEGSKVLGAPTRLLTICRVERGPGRLRSKVQELQTLLLPAPRAKKRRWRTPSSTAFDLHVVKDTSKILEAGVRGGVYGGCLLKGSRTPRHLRVQCHHPRRPQEDMEPAGWLKSLKGLTQIAHRRPLGARSWATTIRGPGMFGGEGSNTLHVCFLAGGAKFKFACEIGKMPYFAPIGRPHSASGQEYSRPLSIGGTYGGGGDRVL